MAYCIAFDGKIKKLFSWSFLRRLGNMSYSYYLIHGLTLQIVAAGWVFLRTWGVGDVSLFLAALPVGFAASWVTSRFLYVTIEKRYSFRRKVRGVNHHSLPVYCDAGVVSTAEKVI